MIRDERFAISRRPYAIDLSSLRADEMPRPEGSTREHDLYNVRLTAVWFRRRRGVTVACIGRLWDFMRGPAPQTAHEALERMTDGRYGGDCQGRWDGEGYWGVESPDGAAAHLATLRPMLEQFPAAPEGFDGWWRFR